MLCGEFVAIVDNSLNITSTTTDGQIMHLDNCEDITRLKIAMKQNTALKRSQIPKHVPWITGIDWAFVMSCLSWMRSKGEYMRAWQSNPWTSMINGSIFSSSWRRILFHSHDSSNIMQCSLAISISPGQVLSRAWELSPRVAMLASYIYATYTTV